MESVLPALVILLTLLIMFRWRFKTSGQKDDQPSGREELAEIVAREKKRLENDRPKQS